MNLVPKKSNRDVWDPFRDLIDVQRELGRLAGPSWLGHEGSAFASDWNPAVDIAESKDSIHIKADMPGLERKDIDISIDGDMLRIKGEKKEEREDKDKNYVRTERFYGSFQRAFHLPQQVQVDKIKAEYKNGVLDLVLPKKEDAKAHQIQVNVQ